MFFEGFEPPQGAPCPEQCLVAVICDLSRSPKPRRAPRRLKVEVGGGQDITNLNKLDEDLVFVDEYVSCFQKVRYQQMFYVKT